ncbi:MAG: RecX family transcriptional regulator, partial [Candidatus Cloacimonetes bacterium]|nr:RecX family transcriptional regulator [Candidatus Cloacimonadota bacterium]
MKQKITLKLRNNSRNIYLIQLNLKKIGILPKNRIPSFLTGCLSSISKGKDSEQELNPDEIDELLCEIEKYAWEKLCNYLAISERTEKQSSDYLKRQYLERDIIQQLIERAKEYGYIDNARYAEFAVTSMINRKKSKGMVKQKLRESGLGEDLVETAL